MPVISKRFADELADKEMRDAYVEAQTRVKIAHQIKSLRTQREWSQGDLGELLGKPQSNVSRLEDVNVGKYTLSTLFELASAFDIALLVQFVTHEEFLRRTADLSSEKLQVPSFDRAALQPLCDLDATSWLHVPFAAITSSGTFLANSNALLNVTGLSGPSNVPFNARGIGTSHAPTARPHTTAYTYQPQDFDFSLPTGSTDDESNEQIDSEESADPFANRKWNKLSILAQMQPGSIQ
jgi:transcriptional regulator with XRE-family HTH domain